MAKTKNDSLIELGKVGETTGTLIFLHGLGDSATGWFQPLFQFRRKYPELRVVLPTAPVQPVTVNKGMKMTAWHDIVSLDTIDSEEFKGLDTSLTIVHSLIDKEIALGRTTEHIILAGFSQGAALSVYAGFQYPKKLAGICGLSGYLPHHNEFSSKINDANKTTPLWLGHGNKDAVVKYDYGKRTSEVLSASGITVTFESYPNMGHSSCPQEMTAFFNFVKTNLQLKGLIDEHMKQQEQEH